MSRRVRVNVKLSNFVSVFQRCLYSAIWRRAIDGLPDPRGSLSTNMCREAIAAANQEVQKELNATKKCGQYKKYTPAQRSAIGKYSCLHGAAAAAKHFSKLWGSKICDSTVKSIKKAYLQEMRKRPRSDDGEEIAALPTKKRGRKLLTWKFTFT